MRNGFILFLIALGCWGCKQQEPAPPAPPVSAVQAVSHTAPSNDENTVSDNDLQARFPFLSKEDQEFVKTPIGRQNMLQLIAREKLISLAARAQGLDKNPDFQALLTEKRAQLDKIYQDYAEQALRNFWYEKQYQNGALAVTEEEIDAYYKKYPYEMTIKQIIVDNAETADQLLRTLKSSRSRWKEFARQYNTAPQIMREEISFMPGEFLPDIEVIAANSANGSVQGFFKTAYGFHIIMKTGEKRLSLEEARPRIRAVLESNKLDKLLESLQNKYEVVVYD